MSMSALFSIVLMLLIKELPKYQLLLVFVLFGKKEFAELGRIRLLDAI